MQASRLLTRANLRDALDSRRQSIAVGAWETLQRLSDHARASIGDFLDDAYTTDLKKADEEGKLPLVKELTERIIPTENGDIRQTTVKLHDAQAALITLMKHHLLKEELGKGERPKTERELDEMLMAEIRRVKGDDAAERHRRGSPALRGATRLERALIRQVAASAPANVTSPGGRAGEARRAWPVDRGGGHPGLDLPRHSGGHRSERES